MSDFKARCYQLLRTVPKGKVTTYKCLAKALGGNAYRAVGNAMNANTDIPATPCHRVVCSDGTLGGYRLGLDKKIEILNTEGVQITNGKTVDLAKYLHDFS